jgi:hypothetical protein
MPPAPQPLMDRFMSKVKKTESCWLWSAQVDRATGYGKFAVLRPDNRWGMKWAHRVSYELHVGAIREVDA